MFSKAGLLCALVGLASAGLHAAAEDDLEAPKPGVLFTGTSLPLPPQQGKPWEPPASKLPEKWVSSMRELVRYGFADPRGCEYRQVKLTWGGGDLATTHAWVMPLGPGENAAAQRFAVTWDGLVYPVVEVGPPADLKADVEAMLDADDKWWNEAVEQFEKKTKQNPEYASRYQPRRWKETSSEDQLLGYQSMLPLKSCVLFLLGEAALAERMWNAWLRGVEANSEQGDPAGDAYLTLVYQWGWAMLDRVVGAHCRGDDVITMLSARSLVGLQAAVQPVAAQRGFHRPRDYGRNDESELPFLTCEDPPARLLADATRRVKAGPAPRVLEVGLDKFPDRSKRIAALVRDLEIGSGTETSQPAGVSIPVSAIVEALVKEGPPAVEPLLDCLANDRRLTREVVFPRNPSPWYHVVAVDEDAFSALRGILQVESFGPLTEDGYDHRGGAEPSAEHCRAVAEEIRRYWQKNKGLSQPEAWLGVLADAQASPKRWLAAAEKIVKGRPLAGESLRGKTDPSVTELLAQRADETATRARLQQSDFDDGTACELTICLAKWDLKAAVPAIHRRITQSRHFAADRPGQGDHGLRVLGESVALLVEAGIQAGDDAVIDDYAAWMRATPEKAVKDSFGQSTFIPLYRHPDNPKFAELARWMFLSEESVWHPVGNLAIGSLGHELCTSPLVGLPAFRDMLKQELADRSPVGTAEFNQDGSTLVANQMGMQIRSQYAPDMEVPKAGEKRPLRTCDFYATQLSYLDGAPRFEIYWPEKGRDTAIAEMASFLDRWGNCFRDHSKVLNGDRFAFSKRNFNLVRLAQPATAEDVAAGRAMFSLRERPDTQVRVVDLKPYPAIGRWKTLQQFRLAEPITIIPPGMKFPIDDKTLKSLPRESFDREGFLWQAEEVQVDGKWRRYYGFVGNHIIAKVPAEEVELLDKFTDERRMLWYRHDQE